MNQKYFWVLALLSLCNFALSKEASTKESATKGPNTVLFVFREDCYNMLLNQHTITGECISYSISRALNLGIIAGSLLYKAPQIIKILQKTSVEGISITSYYFQFAMVLVSLFYNIHIKAPIATYGENISIFFQNALLIILHWKFNPKTNAITSFLVGAFFAGFSFVLYSDILPEYVWEGVGIANIVLLYLSLCPQIYENWKNKSTGVLAVITVFLSFAGSIARVFTTIKEVEDRLLLILFISATFLNLIVLLQIFIYGDKSSTIKPSERTTESGKRLEKSPERKNKPKRE